MKFDGGGFSTCNLRIDKQGGVSVNQTYIDPTGGISLSSNVFMTSAGSIFPTYIQVGALKIYGDGSIYSGNREIIDAQGNINASCINWGEGGVIAAPSYVPPQNVYQGSPLDY